MPFDYDDPYISVDVHIVRVTAKAIHVESEYSDRVWIPRCYLHGGDETHINDHEGEDLTLKIRRWIAEREGLI